MCLLIPIFYFQHDCYNWFDRLNEAEATLLLGLKNNAQPSKSLERVLYQFRKENIVSFDTAHYTLRQFNIDYNHSLVTINISLFLQKKLNFFYS